MKNNFTKEITKGNEPPSVVIQFSLLAVLLMMMAILSASAQTINPMKYWTFNGTNATADSMGVSNLNFTTYSSQYTVGTNGQVGKYVTLDNNSSLIDGGSMNLTNSFTIEFLFKPGYKFNTTNLIKRADGSLSIRMEYAKLTFYTSHKSASGANIEDNFEITLDGIGRKSYGYYVDNNWHHLVFTFDGVNGTKQIWVDGQLASGFSKSVTPGTFANTGNINFWLNHTVSYVKYFGSIDELAIYNTAIPAALIYKHYLGVQSGQPYNFVNNYTQPIPAASSVTGPVDVNDFAIGHPNVTMTAMEQLNLYPVPRYKPGNTLLKNFNWMDPNYMGGLFQPGVSQSQAVTNSVTIQTELAKNFNYYFNVELGNNAFQTAWQYAANANPAFKIGLVIFRAQLNGNMPELKVQNKPNDHYLQNSSGQFIDINGNVTSTKIWRPTAPVSSYAGDGNNIKAQLNDMYTRLNRPIDMINENGEVFPFISQTAAAMDPVVTSAKNASGLDWPTFLSKKFMENETQSYRDIFMTHPMLANTKFTEFSIEGYPPMYTYKYSEARKINSQINNQYYSTASVYTRWPGNWRNWMSAWHGWQWIVESRVNELALNDKLYSPFVSAGWDANEEVNIRPAPWLGLLKSLNMSGAEFFYSCFFSIGAPWPDSKNWVWQAAIPSYAQGVTSRYEDFLRNGVLLEGDVADSYINPTAPGYSFWAGDLRKLVVVRKHNSNNKYAITGSIQPNTNIAGNVENEGVAKIVLDGQTVSFKVRRQGSTYIYDKSNAAAPVFYQLDGWHENTHPSRWSKDFNLEGELFDNTNSQVSIKTSVPAGTTAGDFTNFTSYVSWPDNTANPAPVEYHFSPRSGSNNELYVWIRARARGGVSTSMNVQVDNAASKSIGCISDTAWTWYRYDACSQLPILLQGLTIDDHIFRITPGNDKLEIDKILLTTDVALILNSAPPACGSATATVTPNGSTSFCQGGSVVLTASSGTSYQWMPGGQTTQSITVSTSGSYYVNVSSGSGCAAISNAVTVNVSQAPSATITAGGSTTLCQGATVTLNAPAGAASYLWIPGGQTTQSITTGTAGSYSVRVTNAGGCSTTSNPVTVSVGNTPAANITAGGPTAFCQGGSVTLTASAANAYLWFPGGQTTQSITATSANSYSVRVTGSGGCTAMSAPVAVTINPAPAATITAGGPTTICNGGTVSLTASSEASYLWTPGGQTTQTINVGSAGSYTVRVTNASGCSAISSATNVTVSSNPTATITPSGATSFCAGGSVNLSASAGAAYLWTPGGQTTQTISASSTGAYSVRVTNAAGCSAISSNTNVNVIAAPNAAIAPNGPTNFCTGGSVTLTSTGGASYLWTPGGQTSQSINVTSSGAYSVRVTNSSGCSAISSVTNVSVNSSPIATITPGGSTNLCQGQSVALTASNGSSYLWSNGQTTQSINVSTAGSYAVTVSSGAGCSATSSPQSVTVSPAVNASITPNGPTSFMQGQSVTLTAAAGSSYLWTPGGETTQSIVVTASGNYSVTVFNAAGCSATSSPEIVTVIPVTGPPASITTNGGTAICPGQNLILSASAGSAYLWTPGGQTTQSITVSAGGNYSVMVTSLSGSFASTADIDITMNPAPAAPAIMSTYIPNSSFQLKAYEPTAYNYRWANGSTSQTITVNSGGKYTVWAINGMGCESSPKSMVVTSLAPQPCGNPNMLSHYGITKHDAVVSWNPAVTADTYTQISNNNIQSVYVRGNESSVKLNNLIEGESYKWTVLSICGTTQTGSNFLTFTTLTGPLPCGSTPQYLQTYNINATHAKLSWFDTQSDKFVVRYRVVGSTNYQYRRSFNTLTEAMIQSLIPSTTYEWSVRSMCGNNVSLYSEPQFFTTLSACPGVGNVTVTELGFDKARLTWNSSVGVDTVMIRYAVSGTTNYKVIKIAGNPGNYFILGLTAQTTYDAWVATKCSSGSTSMWGTGVTFTTFNEPNPRYTEEAGPLHLNAFPNPTKYQIGYVFDSKDVAPYTVKVCDMAGRELLTEVRTSDEGLHGDEVSLAGFPSGLYMLVVQKGPMIGRFKFNISE
ncbi:MAG TPA: hypothetical protein PKD91_02210 [Bacteroidia bacterium]|nr:hypothetical protein [Bacteroidia bacterium]